MDRLGAVKLAARSLIRLIHKRFSRGTGYSRYLAHFVRRARVYGAHDMPAELKVQLRDEKLLTPTFDSWLAAEIQVRRQRFPLPQNPPALCVLTPVYHGTDLRFFDELERSLKAQTLSPHLWVIVVDGPIGDALAVRLRAVAVEPGVRLIEQRENEGITRALAVALKHAAGDYVLPIDADDLLTEDALQVLAHEVERTGRPAFLYSDEDLLIDGRPVAPYLRPDFDPILAKDSSYIWHLAAIRRDVALQLDLYSDHAATWCHDWDTVLRIADAGLRIVHVPEILYHWRRHTLSASNRTYVNQRSLDSVRHVLHRQIKKTSNAELFEVAEFPLNRGVTELYIRRHRKQPPPAIAVVYGDTPLRPSLVQRWNAALQGDARTIAVDRETAIPVLKEQLRIHSEFVLFRHELVDIDAKTVFWEAVRLFELHRELAGIGGIVTGLDHQVVDGCCVLDPSGRLLCPWVGSTYLDGGPWALSLKAHRVARPSTLIAAFRSQLVMQMLKHSPMVGSVPELASLLADEVTAAAKLVCYSPLFHGHVSRRLPTKISAITTRRVRLQDNIPLLGLAGFWRARGQFK